MPARALRPFSTEKIVERRTCLRPLDWDYQPAPPSGGFSRSAARAIMLRIPVCPANGARRAARGKRGHLVIRCLHMPVFPHLGQVNLRFVNV